MRVLTFTCLYPNAEQPNHGVFVEERLRHLRDAHPEIDALVVAPVPWYPFKRGPFARYAKAARVPGEERRQGFRILHPRYPVIPKIGMSVAPLLMAGALFPLLRDIKRSLFDFDLIDAHFLYPDGIAAAAIGRMLNVPVVVTARGNDLSLYPRWTVPRAYLRWCLRNTAAVITVCQALADAARVLVPERNDFHVLRNGVDLDKFRPLDRDAARRDLGIDGFTLISVGHLIERKGHHLIVEALSELPGVTLLIAGDGEMAGTLRNLARKLGVAERVRFLGNIPHDTLIRYYNAADALVLASSREGWANVLLEAMACGTPVVATAIWGTPEVVRTAEAGQLVQARTPEAIAGGVKTLRANYPRRSATRAYAEGFSWQDTSDALWRLFQSLVCGKAARRAEGKAAEPSAHP